MAPIIKCGDGFHYYVNGDPLDSCLCRYFGPGARGLAIHNGIAEWLANVNYNDVVPSSQRQTDLCLTSARARIRSKRQFVRVFVKRMERATAYAVQRCAERARLDIVGGEMYLANLRMQELRRARRMYIKENRAETTQTSLHGGVVRGAWRAVIDEHVRPWEWEPDALCT